MDKKMAIIIAVIVIAALAGFLLLSGQNNAPTTETEGDEQIPGQKHVISYDGQSYIPQEITVNTGDTVVFENNSSEQAWPASNEHPLHTDYSGFDSRGPVPAGSLYSFTFQRAGVWGYHDHIKPVLKGTITVKEQENE